MAPLVRKVFGQIAAKEFVSVQPMNLPSGLVFYLDFQYGGTQVNSPANAANTAKQPFANGSSLYGTPSPVNPATCKWLFSSIRSIRWRVNLCTTILEV